MLSLRAKNVFIVCNPGGTDCSCGGGGNSRCSRRRGFYGESYTVDCNIEPIARGAPTGFMLLWWVLTKTDDIEPMMIRWNEPFGTGFHGKEEPQQPFCQHSAAVEYIIIIVMYIHTHTDTYYRTPCLRWGIVAVNPFFAGQVKWTVSDGRHASSCRRILYYILW